MARQEDVVVLICEDDFVPLRCARANCQQWLVHLHNLEGNVEHTDVLADKSGAPYLARVVHDFAIGHLILCADFFCSEWKMVDHEQSLGGTTVPDAPLSTVRVSFSDTTSFSSIGVS